MAIQSECVAEGEARLSDVRLFLYREFPESNAAMSGFGMFYINYITPEQQHIKVSEPVYFWRFALVEGDLYTLATHVLGSLSSAIISPRTQQLVAQEFAEYVECGFCFNRLGPGLPYLPMLVFVLDIIIPHPQTQKEKEAVAAAVPDYADWFYLVPCRTTLTPRSYDNNGPDEDWSYKYAVDLQVQRLAQSQSQQVEDSDSDSTTVDDLYRILQALRSSSLYRQQSQGQGLIEAKHAEVALALANHTFFMLKPTFKLMQHKDLAGQDECNYCPICYDNIIHNDVLVKFVGCKHVFHRTCFVSWLSKTKNQTCPYCRSYCVVDLFS